MQKFLNKGGWIAAAVLALILFVQNYLVQNPYPTDAPADSTSTTQEVQ